MKLRLRRIAPLQAGKMLAAFYGLMSLIIVPFVLIFVALSTLAAGTAAVGTRSPAALPAIPLMLGMGVGFILLLPVLYATMGFVFGIIAALVYNLLGRWLGGFEFEFESAPPSGVVPPSAPPPPARG